METVMRHEARQVPSWLIFDVRQRMKPRMHMKVVGVSPLVGVVVFFVGFGVLALTEAPIWQFGPIAAFALSMALASWAAARWLIRADCPKCSGSMKLGKDRSRFLYVCPRCQTVVANDVTIAQMYGVRDPVE